MNPQCGLEPSKGTLHLSAAPAIHDNMVYVYIYMKTHVEEVRVFAQAAELCKTKLVNYALLSPLARGSSLLKTGTLASFQS